MLCVVCSTVGEDVGLARGTSAASSPLVSRRWLQQVVIVAGIINGNLQRRDVLLRLSEHKVRVFLGDHTLLAAHLLLPESTLISCVVGALLELDEHLHAREGLVV